MSRSYAGRGAKECLGRSLESENVFIGDSTVREVFWAMARQLNRQAALEASTSAERHQDLTFAEGRTSIQFYWDPYLNSSHAPQYMSRTRANALDGEANGLVVIGAGLWFSGHKRDPIQEFKEAIDALTSHLPLPDTSSLGIHRPRIMPVQPPYYEKLDEGHKMLKPDKINAMNEYLEEIADMHDVDLLTAFLRMADNMPGTAWEPRGLHLMPQVTDRQAELLLNLHCNSIERSYPLDGTCCLDYKWSFVQLALGVAGTALLGVVLWTELQIWTKVGEGSFFEKSKKHLPTLWAFLIMCAVLLYCYLADRTHLFNKMSKLYNTQDWCVFIVGITIAGVATIRKSVTPGRPNQEKPTNQNQPFLSRDQTDEWKGWMQLLILAYHYTGGSKVLWIYKIIRLLVASYLFMTGYGHAAYFYQKNDFSMKRVVAILIRLNLLSFLLPWSMQSDYLFYYFAPLVTYWYAVIYITMRVKSHWNQNMTLFLVKVGISACLTTVLHTQPWLLEPFFQCINYVFGSRWDATEWLFRCALDQYIVYIGMLVSVLYIRAKKPPAPPAPPQNSMATTAHTRPGKPPHLKNSLYFAASGSAILVYCYVSSLGTTKTSSNALHTYISPLPILAFVHLRNSSRSLRNYYSEAFAWIGKISLETFILQYHIWMAADTKGLLDLGWFGVAGMGDRSGILGRGMGLSRWADCIILGMVFVWVGSKTAAATGGITAGCMKVMFG